MLLVIYGTFLRVRCNTYFFTVYSYHSIIQDAKGLTIQNLDSVHRKMMKSKASENVAETETSGFRFPSHIQQDDAMTQLGL